MTSRVALTRAIERIVRKGKPLRGNGIIAIGSYPGIRTVNLNKTNLGNPLTNAALEMLGKNLANFHANDAAELVIFGSSKPGLFSGGLPKIRESSLQRVNYFSNLLCQYSSDKHSLVVYDGIVRNAAYSAFADGGYLLATNRTNFKIKGFPEGRFPLGAGLLWRIIRLETQNIPIARYLAVSERKIDGLDMAALGLVDYVTNTNPQENIIHAIGNTYDDGNDIREFPFIHAFDPESDYAEEDKREQRQMIQDLYEKGDYEGYALARHFILNKEPGTAIWEAFPEEELLKERSRQSLLDTRGDLVYHLRQLLDLVEESASEKNDPKKEEKDDENDKEEEEEDIIETMDPLLMSEIKIDEVKKEDLAEAIKQLLFELETGAAPAMKKKKTSDSNEAREKSGKKDAKEATADKDRAIMMKERLENVRKLLRKYYVVGDGFAIDLLKSNKESDGNDATTDRRTKRTNEQENDEESMSVDGNEDPFADVQVDDDGGVDSSVLRSMDDVENIHEDEAWPRHSYRGMDSRDTVQYKLLEKMNEDRPFDSHPRTGVTVDGDLIETILHDLDLIWDDGAGKQSGKETEDDLFHSFADSFLGVPQYQQLQPVVIAQAKFESDYAKYRGGIPPLSHHLQRPLSELSKSIRYCFHGADINHTKRMLEKIASERDHPDQLWAKDTLTKITKIPEQQLKQLYEFTEVIADKDRFEAFDYEIEFMKRHKLQF